MEMLKHSELKFLMQRAKAFSLRQFIDNLQERVMSLKLNVKSMNDTNWAKSHCTFLETIRFYLFLLKY